MLNIFWLICFMKAVDFCNLGFCVMFAYKSIMFKGRVSVKLMPTLNIVGEDTGQAHGYAIWEYQG